MLSMELTYNVYVTKCHILCFSEISTVSITTNPQVLKDCAKDRSQMTMFIHLVLEYLEHLCHQPVTQHFEVLPDDSSFKGDLQAVQNGFLQALHKSLEKRDNHSKMDDGKGKESEDSVLTQLSKITVCADGASNGQKLTPTGLNTNTNKKVLIEEIEVTKNLITPKYDLHISQASNTLVLTVHLPHVTSVSQCQLDVSQVRGVGLGQWQTQALVNYCRDKMLLKLHRHLLSIIGKIH